MNRRALSTAVASRSVTETVRAAAADLVAAVAAGRPAVLSGIVEAAWPWALSALLPPDRAAFVLCADLSAATLLRDALTGLDPQRPLLLLPERDAAPFAWTASDPAATGARLAALLALAGKPAPTNGLLVIASVRAALQRTLPPATLLASRQRWLPGDRFKVSSVLTAWLALGYEAVGVVEEPGTFSRRGGIIDIYPADADCPVRIELFDDEIETLRTFDPVSQRSEELLDELVLLPAREALPDNGQKAALRLRSLDATGCRGDVQARWEASLDELGAGRSFDGIELLLGHLHEPATACDFVPPNTSLVFCDISNIVDAAQRIEAHTAELAETMHRRGDVPAGLHPTAAPWATLDATAGDHPLLLVESGACPEHASPVLADAPTLGRALAGCVFGEIATQSAPDFAGQMPRLLEQCRRWADDGFQVVLATLQQERLEELLLSFDLPGRRAATIADGAPAGFITLIDRQLPAGWAAQAEKAVVLTDSELFGPQPRAARRRRATAGHAAAFLADLNVGDYVIHVDHGLGRFAGITHLDQGSGERGYLLLEYAGADRLYVPTDQLDRVSRYVGTSDGQPTLNKLGTTEWARAKARAREAVQKIARELLLLYAQRQATPGYAFPPDTAWQQEMESAFPYDETPDQRQAIADVKGDMEDERIMDRLVCGDVGYGKTEVALRAAFKAVSIGKQAALLVPTTVLAQQHERTFRERLAAFPVRIEVLSRFRSPKELTMAIAGIAAGTVDIVIGTHRLLQKDVTFKDLGLLIIDEEQRFGVAHKEALKQLRTDVDVLTLTATPIPRTLHMALAGVRDMSVIETPPEERQPVKTYIARYDDRLVRDAILREIDRGGQVYVVHNRVRSIPLITAKIAELVPEAKVTWAHGQMTEDRLEKVMLQFAAGDYQVLVCTTIIESGLDISNVNTILINDATHYGLAQLYQLRGRVGRGNRRAYAYLLYSNAERLPPLAEKRLRAIFEASELGAGFRIAMKDLEIRGAGNLLGAEQHGHVAAVGFDLYTKMLAEEVETLKGAAPVRQPNVQVELAVAAFLPDDYIPDQTARIDCYRRLARATTVEEAAELREEIADRFGAPPEPVTNLLDVVEIKARCLASRVQSVVITQQELTVRLSGPRDYPRAPLIRRFGAGVKMTVEQVRVPRARVSEQPAETVRAILDMVS